MSVALDILRTYRAPRRILRRQLDQGVHEARALAVLMGACLLMFVAQWPRLSREAFFDSSVTLEARLAGALFGWLLLAPLFFYILALLSHWVLRLLGSGSSPYEARISLFWSLLASAPMMLLTGLSAGFVGATTATNFVGVLALVAFLGFWGAGMLEISRGQRTA